jgi:3',5'-cyclic AMP phosphodiesterase CpdA
VFNLSASINFQDQTQRNEFDMALHVGDFGYDMWWFDGDVGDKFFRTIEPIASRIPYMVIPGNHETWANFTQYKGRFTMPNTVDNTFYSFDLGPAHIIGYNTEIYYTLFSKHQLKTQWECLIQDLEAANNNRDNVPWIIAMGHRPMYCSTNDEVSSSCGDPNNVVRVGLKGSHEFGLENLFYKYGVDLELYGHEHNYERMYPVFNNTVWKGVKAPYTDPPAPVHIVTGSAGCQENTDDFIKNPSPWSDVRSSDYGFSRMQIFNSSHLYFEQVRAYDVRAFITC